MLTDTEGNTRLTVKGEVMKDWRSYKAVACTKRCTQELGKPYIFVLMTYQRLTALETRKVLPETGLGADNWKAIKEW